MSKRYIIILIIFLFILLHITGVEDVFYYKYNYEKDLFEFSERCNTPEKWEKQEKIILNFKTRMEKEFNIVLKFKYISFKDAENNAFSGYIVNIITKGELYEYFQGPTHRSITIETIKLNILQPYATDWKINFIILKINGIFSGNILQHVIYSTIDTSESYYYAEDLYDWNTYPEDLKK